MQDTNETEGRFGRLPNGERVMIETVYDDARAVVRRIEGERAGTRASCAMANLEILEKASQRYSNAS